MTGGCPRPPLEFGPEGHIADAATLLDRLDKRESAIRGLKATAKVTIESPDRKGSVDELIAASRPADLHLETLDFFGRPLAVLVTSGGRFSLFDSEKNAFYRGPATAANLARLLPMSMPPADVVSILLGDAPRIAPTKLTLTLDDDRRAYRVSASSDAATQSLLVSTRDLRVIESEIRGTPSYSLVYSDFVEDPFRAFAHRLRFTAGDQPLSVEVALSDVEVNPPADPAMYVLDPPPGARVVDVDAAGHAPDVPR